MGYFGFLLIDKDKGISSHDAVFEVRRKLGCKVGHTGTLDPFATGLLIMALGKATRLAEFVQKQDKEYEVEIVLGEERSSYDVTGEVIDTTSYEGITEEKIQKAVKKFEGKITQVPPKYSALKVGGVRAYRLAREGKDVKLKERKVNIKNIEILDISIPSIKLRVQCSTGTYIRSLAHDLGLELGTLAYAKELKRTGVGEYSVDNAITIGELLELDDVAIQEKVIPPREIIRNLPEIKLNNHQYEDLRHGREIMISESFDSEETGIAVFNNKLVGILKIIQKKDGVTLKPDKVFV